MSSTVKRLKALAVDAIRHHHDYGLANGIEEAADEMERLQKEVENLGQIQGMYNELSHEADRLKAIVDGMPKTADGVTVCPAGTYRIDNADSAVSGASILRHKTSWDWIPNRVHSTREATKREER